MGAAGDTFVDTSSDGSGVGGGVPIYGAPPAPRE
jgi:hypothetical protein